VARGPTAAAQEPEVAPPQPTRRNVTEHIHCVSKNIPDILDCNLKKDYRILIIFGEDIPETTGHQIIMQFPTYPSYVFALSGEIRTNEMLHFYFFFYLKWYYYLL